MLRPLTDTLMLAAVAGMLASGAGGAAAAAAWPYVQQLGQWRGLIYSGALVVWSVGAWMLSPTPPPLDIVEGQGEEDPGPPDDDPAAGAPADEQVPDDDDGTWLDLAEVAAIVQDVAARHDHTGVHLADLLAHPEFEGWDQAELRAAFEDDWHVPVVEFKLRYPVEGLKKKRERVRIGVRLADLRDRLAEAPTTVPERGQQTPAEHPVQAPVQAPVQHPVQTPYPGLYLVRSEPLPEPPQGPRTVAG